MAAEATHMTCMEVWGGSQLIDTAVQLPGLEAWVYSKPYASATEGGDVHYVSSCATGRITRLLVADVSGHGAEVSSTAAQLRSLMRKYINHIDQTRFVESMNQQFATLAKAGTFATALVTTFFAPTSGLSLCNAGHPPPLWYRHKTKEWTFLEQQIRPSSDLSNIPLGIEGLVRYEQIDVQLDLGDWVLCYTDSLVESHNADGEILGSTGLLDLARALPIDDPATFTRALLDAIAAIDPRNLTEDDVTVLLFRHNSRTSDAKFPERVRAFFRMLYALRPGAPDHPWPEFTLANIGGAIFKPLSRLRRSRRDQTAA